MSSHQSGRPGGIFTKSRNLVAGRDFVPKTAWAICYFSVVRREEINKNKKPKEKEKDLAFFKQY